MNPRYLLICVLALCSYACAGARPRAVAPVATATCEGNRSTPHDLSSLVGCTHVMGDVHVSGNLRELGALANLRRISGALVVSGNPRLTSLGGLQNLKQARHVVIVNNPALVSVAQLSSLAIAKSVTIAGNRQLEAVSGIGQVGYLEGLVVIDNGIRNVRGFDRLTSVGDLVVAGNHKLIDIHGLSQLESAKNVYIENNPRLAPSERLLQNLIHVENQLMIRRNAGMVGSRLATRLTEQLKPTVSYVARR